MNFSKPLPTDVSIITTYRCCMRCRMCNIWKYPTEIKREIRAKELEILPRLKFVNITGGEPFVRRDLADIVEVAFKRAPRVVISTAGYHVDDILALAERFPKIGIRVSIEGLSTINDHLRGRASGFDRGIRTLLGLREMGVKDIGFGITVSNNNSSDMLQLYELAKNLKMEFATASYHNSYYFHKNDNFITNKDEVTDNFFELIDRLLAENHPKSWFRAFFNLGVINYIKGNRRFLPCEAGTANFFIEPYGEVYPCNGLEERYWKESMGNIRDVDSFEDLWFSRQAEKVRELVRTCPKNCWMVGTASPVMKKYIKHPLKWVVKHKFYSLMGKKIDRKCLPDQFDVGQSRKQGDLRGPRIKLEEIKEEYPLKSDMRFMTEVISLENLTDDVFTLRLKRDGFQFFPGQNVCIGPHLKYHKNRDYTLCSGVNDNYLEFLVKEIKHGNISSYLKKLQPGDKVDIVGPYGEFAIQEPDEEKLEHVFIASGVGVGPFLCFIKSYPNLKYQLIHGIRFENDLIMAKGVPRDHYTACISRESGKHYNGRVNDYLQEHPVKENSFYYICGNPYMVHEVQRLLEKRNIDRKYILTENYYAY